ncbi:PAS-domain containing protein [Roseibium sp. HPY-6]|uniref:PAS-domain containing protein n=1 Tax=Roseibium sp. HPY-6 TaxID=3229852 RepID=UPI00338DDD34
MHEESALAEQNGMSNIEPTDTLLETVLSHVDFGLAVFDINFKLITANECYFSLCEYDKDTIEPGVALQELMTRSLSRKGEDPHQIEATIATTLLRLKVGGTHKFVFRTVSGKNILITRTLNAQQQLIETVREVTGLDGETSKSDQLRHVAETAHARMMHALNAMTDGFALYDADDHLVFYNQKFIDLNRHLSGFIRPGMSFEEMLRSGVVTGAYNQHGMDDEAYIHWRLQQHFNPGEPHEHETADGRWIRTIDTSADDGGTVCVQSDITKAKEHETEIARISGALDKTSDRFNEALNNMIQGLCMFDNEQKLILCNRRYLEMYGFSAEVVKPGILIADIMRYSISLGNYREEDAQAALKARHDPSRLKKRTTIKQHLRDGRVIAVMNEPMVNGGSIATYQDITAMERHEARLVAYTKKLETSNRELQDFAYVASHDLQEPLRKIEAFGDRLIRKYGDLLPDDGKMFVDRMQNAGSRMRQLINDLLSYSRITTKARPFVAINMKETMDGILSDLQIRIQEHDATVEVEDLPTIDADPIQMRQLFQNVLSNALKYKKPDVNPVVKISAETVEGTDESGAPQTHARFAIADNGIGFDNQYKDQIFKIFQRLHGRLEYEGTGIGLATCRKIVDRHSGSIDAHGEPDVGATFFIELPLRQSNTEDQD